MPELKNLEATPKGLSEEEARQRLLKYGRNLLKPERRSNLLSLLISQFGSPLVLILIFAAGLSYFLGDHTDTLIIFAIVFLSGLLGFWQEKGANDAVEKLLATVQVKAMVLRDGKEIEIPVEAVVPGDIVILNAGDGVPGDALIIESKDLYVNEAALTGETFPAEKMEGVLPAETAIAQRKNMVFMGTHVISGSATVLVEKTGLTTEFGKVSSHLQLRRPETEFEHGVRHFGYMLMEVTLLLIIAIFAINVYFNRPVLEAFLFSLALAVGLTPQLLPAIVMTNLAYGARSMAQDKVIVKRLASIENFGSMNVLCSDKTGTITEGKVELRSALNLGGQESEKVLLYAYLNSYYETGFTNPIDEAIRNYKSLNLGGYHKLDEIPYDFDRKKISILVAKENLNLMVTKGALENILQVCSSAEGSDGTKLDIAKEKNEILRRFKEFGRQGFRCLGIAYRNFETRVALSKEHETDMTFLGFLIFFDPPKVGAAEIIANLKRLGITLKIITGDNELVAAYISREIGLPHPKILKGKEIHRMTEEALLKHVNSTDIFAEVEPNHKERIILALRKAGNVVGFMGDGINDASALHAADVGISVDSAVDVAKEAADIVLLGKDLEVLVDGVQAGRKTFANTLKYVFMATSANFGNMFSMAAASLFLPFLPLLPKQILLNNLLTDLPEMTIATDSVDQELINKPRRWDINFIRNFMLVFGPLSSIFDFATFGVLFYFLHSNVTQFRTGWFIESVVSAATIVLIIRTRKYFWKSRPSGYLFGATLLAVLLAVAFPYLHLNQWFGFMALPVSFLGALGLIVLAYIFLAEVAKLFFYRIVKL